MWRPDIGRFFGIKPWEMGKLTNRELGEIFKYLNELRKEGEGLGS